MKNLNKFILAAGIGLCFMACKKTDGTYPSTVAALTFVNANVGSSPLITEFNNPRPVYAKISSGNYIGYGKSNVFSPVGGQNTLSLVQSTDTTHTLLANTFTLQTSGIYSLFLTGTSNQPDTVFIKENLPVYSHTDSVAGIRFINLSPGSDPVSVDIQSQANGSEAASLSYKGRTSFKTYKADHTVASYIFEFRDVATGNVLATYTLSGVNNGTSASLTSTNSVRFHNMTIALIGQPAGGTVAQTAILVPNY